MNSTLISDYKKYLVPSLLLILLLLIALVPLYLRTYSVIFLSNTFMFIVLTLTWAFFSGPTGYISLATAAFFGVGIYTAAILGDILSMPLLVLSGGLVSAILAFLVGVITLRLRGVYFAIFTFGLVELIKHITSWVEINIVGTRGHFVSRVDNVTVFYVLMIILVSLLLLIYFTRRSRYGLALSSIGSSEEAAAHIGVNVVALKVAIFAVSAFFAGMVGTIMATRWGFIDPYIAYDPFYSFLPVLMAIFGGMGSLFGPVIGAAVFTYLQEVLITKFPYFYMLIFGTIMVITILYLPNGLVGLFQNLIDWIRKLWLRRSGGEHADSSS